MKGTPIYIIITILVLVGCNRRPSATPLPAELVQAEALMFPNPDSALHILQAMPVPTEPEAKATWALLLTHAKFKCFITQSDSLLNTAYDYFMEGEDTGRKALTLYLKAGLYEDSDQQDKALSYYLPAADESELSKNYRLSFFIHNHIAMIYAYRRLYDYAMSYAKKCNEYALLSEDPRYIAESYNVFARIYTGQKKNTEAIEFYDKAIEVSKKYKDWRTMNAAMNEKAGVLIGQKKFDEALEVLRAMDPAWRTPQCYQVLGHLYYRINQPDSAYYYLNKAIQADNINIYTLRNTYQVLCYLSRKLGDYKKATQYAVKVWEAKDSINKIDKSKALIELQEKYDQQKVINEKNELELRKNRAIQRVLICLLIALAAIAILIYVYQKKLQASREQIRRYIQAQEENTQQISRNEQLIKSLQAQMATDKEQQGELQQTIQTLHQQNDRLKEENQELQLSIERHRLRRSEEEVAALRAQVAEVYEVKKHQWELTNYLVDTDELVMQLREKPKYLDPEDWAKLEALLNGVYNNFTKRLQTRFPKLSEVDIQFCILIRLRFTTSQIAKVMAAAPASVSVQKSRLKKRFQQVEPELFANGELLDTWIGEF